ncbi:MAG: MFS transporter [Gammaproteobacteria bacterium]|nr:MFS transporter [Gammaproteobacteria bacterium]
MERHDCRARGSSAQAFGSFRPARIGVGVGEAGCSPPAHSIISDLYPPHQRSTALSVYNMGIYVGVFIGYLAGGWLDQVLGWRVAFLAVGLPGIMIALLVKATLREPPRGLSERIPGSVESAPPIAPETLKVVFLELWNRRSFRHLSVAAGLHAFVGYGAGNLACAPSPAGRRRTWAVLESTSTWLGPIAAICGAGGAFLGGWLTDRYGVKDARWYIWIPAGAIVASVPLQAVRSTSYSGPHRGAAGVHAAGGAGGHVSGTHAGHGARHGSAAGAGICLEHPVLRAQPVSGPGLACWSPVSSPTCWPRPLGIAEGLRWAISIIVTPANVWVRDPLICSVRGTRRDDRRSPTPTAPSGSQGETTQ